MASDIFTPTERAAGRRWIRLAGKAGLIFFSLKGLAWLIAPAALWFLR